MELIDMVPESDSNNLREIENIQHEYCTDQTQILPEFVFKVITIGDPGSGKSSLLKRLIENKFIEGKITIGVEYNSFAIKVQNK
jgi:ABC-type transport system involved in cytochrome bd biosynthesis fused ATPase/permease subunit